MIEIGGNQLSGIYENLPRFGINEFIICCGYKGEIIKIFVITTLTTQI